MYPFHQGCDIDGESRSSFSNGKIPFLPEPHWVDQEPKKNGVCQNKKNRHSHAPRLVGCISRNLRPVFIFMRIIGLFPLFIVRGTNRRRRRWRRSFQTFGLYLLSIFFVLFNIYLVKFNLTGMLLYLATFGLMHATTVSFIMVSTKPVVAGCLIAFFTFHVKEHLKLIRRVDSVDLSFRAAFRATPPIREYGISFFIASSAFFIVPFVYRIIEFVSTGQELGNPLNDSAFIVVPLLTLWNIVPLLYYCLYNKIVRYYCQLLVVALDREHSKRIFSLKFYYEQFLQITQIQEDIGRLFNPYVLFSLAWSMVLLCLSIYFLTQPSSSLVTPITPSQLLDEEFRVILNKQVHFSIGWATLQVIVALMHISLICSTGMQTNETTRQVVTAVLRVVPDTNADLDRFQISCFVHKMTTQFMWGMTVWRAFPLERSTFFTLVSVIVTYSFLLLKLKENPAYSPIQRTFIFSSNTSIIT